MQDHDGRCETYNLKEESCFCEQRKINHNDFIRLWTAAGPAKNYNKSAWLDVERQLHDVGAICLYKLP